jgi:hypothetical protein
MIAVLALRGVRIDGSSPAHAADRIDGVSSGPSFPSATPAPGESAARFTDRDECAS